MGYGRKEALLLPSNNGCRLASWTACHQWSAAVAGTDPIHADTARLLTYLLTQMRHLLTLTRY